MNDEAFIQAMSEKLYMDNAIQPRCNVEPGMIVRMKGYGIPIMVVKELEPDDMVVCAWFWDGHFLETTFKACMLEPAK